MLLKLSKRINSAMDLRTLATIGLEVEDPIIEGKLYNERDINEAALKVLKEWRKGQLDSRIAYNRLREALRKKGVNMAFYIAAVLEAPAD